MKTSNTLIVIALLLVPGEAFAYLDPGTGSMILQGVLAALFGAAFTIKLYWHRLKNMFTKKAAPDEESGG